MVAVKSHQLWLCQTEDGAQLLPRHSGLPSTDLGWKLGTHGPQPWVANAIGAIECIDRVAR